MKTGKEIIEFYFGKKKAEANNYTSLMGMIDIAILETRVEQDKITRHACAEAVIQCPEDMPNSALKDCAHNACMNVKAV
jgi:hypothetical protein